MNFIKRMFRKPKDFVIPRGLSEVYEYWNSNPCDGGGLFQVTALPVLSKVLEIGCGMGNDANQFIKHGVDYIGIDLTDKAVEIAKEKNPKGRFMKMNAEELDFPDNYFDVVYSFGVIHHTVSPEKIMSEIERVLKPNGILVVMLYNKSSIYYWVEVMFLRKIFYAICNWRVFNLLGGRYQKVRQAYMYRKLFGWDWLSMNTDGAFCPISRVYTEMETRDLFKNFLIEKIYVFFTDKKNWLIGWLIPKWAERKWGWFRIIYARKKDLQSDSPHRDMVLRDFLSKLLF